MTPKVSVIVPVYETWHLIPSLVECLQRQTIRPDQFEVILVDNGSSSLNLNSVPSDYRLLRCEKPGSYSARNKGAAESRAGIFAFTDSDCLPEPGWLRNLVRDISDSELRAGAVEIITSGSKPSLIEHYDQIKGIPQALYVSRGYAATANLAIPAELFRSLGGFDESRYSGGDADFCRRALRFGARLTYVADAVVNHPARTSWSEVVSKARRVKGGQIKNGSLLRRLLWLFRTLLPPVIEWTRIISCKKASVSNRVRALVVETILWLLHLGETARLLLGGSPERK